MENTLVPFLVLVIVACGIIIWRLRKTLKQNTTNSNHDQLEQNQKRFEALVENGSDCIVIISAEGQTTYVSSSVTNILGYTPEEVIEMNLQTLIHPDDLSDSEQILNKALNNPAVPISGCSSRVKHKDGSWRRIEAVLTNFLHDPAINGLVDNFRDITDRVKAEEELQESNERFFLATKGSKLGIWDQDIANDILIWDEAMYKIYGISSKSFKGNFKSWISRIHPEDQHIIQKKAEKVMQGASGFDAEFRIVRPDNSVRHVRALAQVHYDNNGQPVRLIGTNLDITNNKEYEKTLEQILFDISHIIRKPVTNILGLSAVIDSENIDEQTLKECARHLKEEVKELDDFTVSLSETYLKKKLSMQGFSEKGN